MAGPLQITIGISPKFFVARLRFLPEPLQITCGISPKVSVVMSQCWAGPLQIKIGVSHKDSAVRPRCWPRPLQFTTFVLPKAPPDHDWYFSGQALASDGQGPEEEDEEG